MGCGEAATSELRSRETQSVASPRHQKPRGLRAAAALRQWAHWDLRMCPFQLRHLRSLTPRRGPIPMATPRILPSWRRKLCPRASLWAWTAPAPTSLALALTQVALLLFFPRTETHKGCFGAQVLDRYGNKKREREKTWGENHIATDRQMLSSPPLLTVHGSILLLRCVFASSEGGWLQIAFRRGDSFELQLICLCDIKPNGVDRKKKYKKRFWYFLRMRSCRDVSCGVSCQ